MLGLAGFYNNVYSIKVSFSSKFGEGFPLPKNWETNVVFTSSVMIPKVYFSFASKVDISHSNELETLSTL